MLQNLPLRIGTYVPDDLLGVWFAPGTGNESPAEAALEAARAHGRPFECDANATRAQGRSVLQWVPAI